MYILFLKNVAATLRESPFGSFGGNIYKGK